MLTNILIAVGMSCALGTAFNNANANNYINNDSPNNVVYVDEDFSFTLQNNELNFEYINLWQSNTIGLSSIELSYDESNWSLNYSNQYLVSDGFVSWGAQNVDVSILFVVDKTLYIPNNEPDFEVDNYHFYINQLPIDEEEFYSGNIYPTITSIEFQDNGFGSDTWSDLKTALNLDIAANNNSTPSAQDFVSILGEMIGLLTGGLTGFATGIGSGIQTLVSSLFIASNGTSLSVFGAVICIFGGIALAIGLSRLIFQWIASIGAKH